MESFNVFEVLLSIILQFAIILFMVRKIRDISISMSGSAGKQIVEMASKTANTAIGMGAGAALGATAFAGRFTVGRAVGGLSESQSAKEMAASNNQFKRFIGNSILKTGQKAKASSFDLRNSGAGKQLSAGIGKITGGKVNLETSVLSSKINGKERSIDNIVKAKTEKKEKEMRADIARLNMTDEQAKAYWEKKRKAYDDKKNDQYSKDRNELIYNKAVKQGILQPGAMPKDQLAFDALAKKMNFNEDAMERLYRMKNGKRPPTYTDGKEANKAIRDEYLKRRKETDAWKMAGNIVRGRIEGGSPGNESAERTAERKAAENIEKSLKKDTKRKVVIEGAEARLKEISETLKKLLKTHETALEQEKARIRREENREMTEKEMHKFVVDRETAERELRHGQLVSAIENLKSTGADHSEVMEKLVEKKRNEREKKELEKLFENKERDEKTVGGEKEEEKKDDKK